MFGVMSVLVGLNFIMCNVIMSVVNMSIVIVMACNLGHKFLIFF